MNEEMFKLSWSTALAELWRRSLTEPHIRAKIGQLLEEERDRASALTSVDLTKEEGRLTALGLQGEWRGLRRAFDILTEELANDD